MSIPLPNRYAFTEAARFSESFWLKDSLPSLEACPSIIINAVGYCPNKAISLSRVSLSPLSNLLLLALNKILLSLLLIKLNKSVGSSGQPLFSEVPATSGQESSLSGTPSPSASANGQPPFA